MPESGINRVGMPEEDKERASFRPRYEGAVSATTTVILRFRDAARRKASTVREYPIVRMISLRSNSKSTTSEPQVG